MFIISLIKLLVASFLTPIINDLQKGDTGLESWRVPRDQRIILSSDVSYKQEYERL